MVEKKEIYKKIILFFGISFFVVNILLYIDRYYIHFPKNEAENWGLGYSELLRLLENDSYLNRNVIMTRPNYSPYIFLLFYSSYNPINYQTTSVVYPPTDDGFYHVKKFGKFEFRNINWEEDIKIKNSLLVDTPSNVPDFIKSSSYKITDIGLPNGKVMFSVVETQ